MGVHGEWIKFVFMGHTASGKTGMWTITDVGDNVLGKIKWHGPWRKYCFYPDPDTIWEENCLDTVATFIKEQTWVQRTQKFTETDDAAE